MPLSRRRLLHLGGAALGAGLLSAGCSSVGPGAGQVASAARTEVARFSTSRRLGALPEGWRQHITRPDRPVTGYALDQLDGRTVLHAQGDSATSGVRCELGIDPADLAARPWLRWDWRVDRFPAQATVTDDDLDDSPARLVLGFGGDASRLSLRDRLFADQVELFTGEALPFATLCYVWDGLAPREQVLPYARSSRIRYLVVDSGRAGEGRWLQHRRHMVDDYQRVFGEMPGPLLSVGVLTDSDDLKGPAEAWYGDLVIE